jgi:alkylated DNA repair dioxygenase AlkB
MVKKNVPLIPNPNKVLRNLLPQDGEASYFSSFFTEIQSERYFLALEKEVPWKQEPIKMFGKEVMQPRLTAWYGDSGKGYSYSGITMQPNPWNSTLIQIKEKIEKSSGVKFNSALLNFYRDENDSMGWHRDNEKELGENPSIGSVSFGATRTINFRHYFDKTLKTSIDLTDGSFFLMQGETQRYWQHSISKKTYPIGPRINLTFRTILGDLNN